MKCYPKRADRIVKRTMKDAVKTTAEASDHIHEQSPLRLDKAIYYDLDERRAIQFWRFFGFIFCLLILPGIALAHHYHVLTLDVLCAPTRPYTILDSSSSSPSSFHEAPWWLPSSSSSSDILTSKQRYKIFSLVCENRPFTRLEWVDMGIAGHRLLVWDNTNAIHTEDDHLPFPRMHHGKKNAILLDRRTKMARILGSYIEFTNWSGKLEKKKAPWTVHNR